MLLLSDFTSVIELGAGITLASGIAQVLFKSGAARISETLDDIYRLKESIPSIDIRDGILDQKLEEIEMEYVRRKGELEKTALGLLWGNLLGVGVPIVTLYMAPLSGDIGLGMISILGFMSVAWGPVFAAISYWWISSQLQDIEARASELKMATLSGRLET